mmetsp:Transcript_14737/g.35580  ORF Transcript_14737/g.35580 Transcript_14737/m.35580 type:complete len:353 (-) Transcript_14737:36-1094(-)|eukprot:CAMPEP_0180139926 /NCGR_PEP_ID=MMETSP0986-20121125/13867_1 /TAXON_ID=697907 /ORGANISM="non described non described, Strain CCMP2293" /LENGTH=352 /DNA_ID=CAMNT_0022082209 /DNA_START=101 /DNA_END=1159 /DNA_ORIENTATION=-
MRGWGKAQPAGTCACCGAAGASLKAFDRNVLVVYCDSRCRAATWKERKRNSREPLTLADVGRRVFAATKSNDFKCLLQWEHMLDDLLRTQSAEENCVTLDGYERAHRTFGNSDESAVLNEERIALLHTMQRFEETGQALCLAGDTARRAGNREGAAAFFRRARDLGDAHGLPRVECEASIGLGDIATLEGRCEDAVEILRGVLAKVAMVEDSFSGEKNELQGIVVQKLAERMLAANDLDAAEALIHQYRATLTFAERLSTEQVPVSACGSSTNLTAPRLGSPLCDAITSHSLTARLLNARRDLRGEAAELNAILALARQGGREAGKEGAVRVAVKSAQERLREISGAQKGMV